MNINEHIIINYKNKTKAVLRKDKVLLDSSTVKDIENSFFKGIPVNQMVELQSLDFEKYITDGINPENIEDGKYKIKNIQFKLNDILFIFDVPHNEGMLICFKNIRFSLTNKASKDFWKKYKHLINKTFVPSYPLNTWGQVTGGENWYINESKVKEKIFANDTSNGQGYFFKYDFDDFFISKETYNKFSSSKNKQDFIKNCNYGEQ